MIGARKDQNIVNIGPRITEHTQLRLVALWPTTNMGAEWVLNSYPGLFERTLVELKGRFTKSELDLMLDVAELIVFFPEMAGQMLVFNLMDEMALPTLKDKHPDINTDGLLETLRDLSVFQRSVLEIWAQAYRLTSADISRGEYIGELM